MTEQVAWRELIEVVRARLSDEEKRLSDLRAAGCEWTEIASQVGGTAEAAPQAAGAGVRSGGQGARVGGMKR